METLFTSHHVSFIAVVFGAMGAVAILLIGAVTTTKGIPAHLGTGEAKAFSTAPTLPAPRRESA